MLMKRTLNTLLVMLVANAALAADRPTAIDPVRDYTQFTHRFYIEPRPDLIESAMRFVSESGIAKKRSAQVSLGMFYSCVFAQYPAEREAWSKVIPTLREPAREVLTTAMATTPSQQLAVTDASAARNDLNWACFFATGDTEYLNDVLSALQYLDERKDLNRFAAAATAKWSLASLAKQDEKVRAAVEALAQSEDPKLQQVAKEILIKPAPEINAEMAEVVKKQRKAGIW